MKKIIIFLFVFLLTISCAPTQTKYPENSDKKRTSYFDDHYYNVQCNYDVIYNDTTIRYDTIFNCKCLGKYQDEPFKVYASSHRGTNYIIVYPGGVLNNKFVHTTAQIRVNSYKLLDK